MLKKTKIITQRQQIDDKMKIYLRFGVWGLGFGVWGSKKGQNRAKMGPRPEIQILSIQGLVDSKFLNKY